MNTRQKGMVLANYIADQIVAKGIDPKARADGGSGAGNREKADICTSARILGSNLGIEAKNQAKVNIHDWWRQTKKLESLGMEPVLAFKLFGENVEETKVVVYLDTFLELIKNQKGFAGVVTDARKIEIERAMEMVIDAAKVFQK